MAVDGNSQARTLAGQPSLNLPDSGHFPESFALLWVGNIAGEFPQKDVGAGKPRVWSDRKVLRPSFIRALDLHPDGKRFAVFERPETEKMSGNLHVTFLLNFSAQLRRRVPSGR